MSTKLRVKQASVFILALDSPKMFSSSASLQRNYFSIILHLMKLVLKRRFCGIMEVVILFSVIYK